MSTQIKNVDAIVVGAGFGGLYALHHLRDKLGPKFVAEMMQGVQTTKPCSNDDRINVFDLCTHSGYGFYCTSTSTSSVAVHSLSK